MLVYSRYYLKLETADFMRLPKPAMVARDLLSKKKYIFTTEDIRQIYNVSSFYAYRIISRMLNAGVANRIGRGTFILDRNFITHVRVEALIDSLLRDDEYYLGLRYATLFWKMHDMPSYILHVITTNKNLSGKKLSILEDEFKFIYLNKKRFFGYVRIPLGGSLVNISDREKTIIDCLMFISRYVGLQDICKAVKLGYKQIKWDKLLDYALKLEMPSIIQRLGYILDTLGLEDLSETFHKYIGLNYILLDPSRKSPPIDKNRKWRILVNAKCKI